VLRRSRPRSSYHSAHRPRAAEDGRADGRAGRPRRTVAQDGRSACPGPHGTSPRNTTRSGPQVYLWSAASCVPGGERCAPGGERCAPGANAPGGTPGRAGHRGGRDTGEGVSGNDRDAHTAYPLLAAIRCGGVGICRRPSKPSSPAPRAPPSSSLTSSSPIPVRVRRSSKSKRAGCATPTCTTARAASTTTSPSSWATRPRGSSRRWVRVSPTSRRATSSSSTGVRSAGTAEPATRASRGTASPPTTRPRR
jgi:hypothetical protein